MTDTAAQYEMLVRLRARAGQREAVLSLMGEVITLSRAEPGCRAFRVYTTDTPDEIWLYEAYVTKQYHDEVHEAVPQVRRLLEELPGHLAEPFTEIALRPVPDVTSAG